MEPIKKKPSHAVKFLSVRITLITVITIIPTKLRKIYNINNQLLRKLSHEDSLFTNTLKFTIKI